MNLYKVTSRRIPEGDDGAVQHLEAWAGTQADAKQAVKDMRAKFPDCKTPDITPVDFPTDKPGLLAWLNANFGPDNN